MATVAKLKVKKIKEDAVIPEQQSKEAAGLDLAALENIRLLPTHVVKEAYKIRTGLEVEIPKGWHGEIHLRSSIGAKTKLRLANGTGIIDSDYRGELLLLVENVGKYEAAISAGQRIAQLVLIKDTPFEVVVTDTLSKTERGTGGIGSTGK